MSETNGRYFSGKGPGVSRADLVRGLLSFGPEDLYNVAEFAGFELKKKKKELKNKDFKVSTGASTSFSEINVSLKAEESALPSINFIRVVSHERISEEERRTSEPDWFRETEELDASFHEVKNRVTCRHPDLSPWSRLGPFIRAVLSVLAESNQIDDQKAADHMATGKSIACLPFKKRPQWAHSCQIILDFNEKLIPFRKDIRKLGLHLEKTRGISGLDIIIPEYGPCGKYRKWSSNYEPLRQYRLPEPGALILIVSDLGCYDETGAYAGEWQGFGERLKKTGFDPVVLAPVPADLIPNRLRKSFRIISWDRDTKYPRTISAASGKSCFKGRSRAGKSALSSKNESVEQLLSLLSPAIRVEPGLLRSARFLLPRQMADVGAEALAWQSGHVSSSMTALSFEKESIDTLRSRFKTLDKKLQENIAGLIMKWHSGLDPVISAEEALNLMSLTGINKAHAIEFARKATRTFVSVSSLYPYRSGLNSYINRLGKRQHDSAWHDSEETAMLWTAANRSDISKSNIELPEGFDISKVAWLLDLKNQPIRLTLRQKGTSLVFDENGWSHRADDSLFDETGSPVGTVISALEKIQVAEKINGRTVRTHLVDVNGPVLQVSLFENKEIEIKSDFDRIRLDHVTKPDWAESMGRDSKGLFVTLPDKRKAYWTNPSEYMLRRNNQPYGLYSFKRGFWWDEVQHDYWFERFIGEGPRLASTTGLDEFGLYMDVVFSGITQRFRWITPGEFSMGSPEDEPERHSDEKQHQVILTKGYWLADTTCTQGLWTAVMGNNPSRFKGDERPVENISWNDAAQFINKINSLKPGLDLRLPTEAEWEYACRAGTTTPFSFGSSITTDEVNFHGNSPNDAGKKYLYRAETVDVKSLPLNQWGFYEMHGNVLEWCQDWNRVYKDEYVVDPIGEIQGQVRVMRGGSWFGNRSLSRSSQRNSYYPDSADPLNGFRLARGL